MLRKAVSPLIATVLLIAITVTIGTVVFNFQEKTTIELRDKATKQIDRGVKCSLDLKLKVVEINNQQLACYNRSGSTNFEVVLENQGSVSAEGVRIFLLDNNEAIKTADAVVTLGAHNRTKYNISIATLDDESSFAFPPAKVIISPILKYSTNSVEICSNNELELEDIDQC